MSIANPPRIDREELKLASRALSRCYSIDELKIHFRERTLDHEFEALGRIALAHRDWSKIDFHIFIWTGYEVVTESIYFDRDWI